MSEDPKRDDEGAPTERRDFLIKAAVTALGAGVVGALDSGEAKAAAPPAAGRQRFTFTSNIVPAALTDENIKKITDALTAQLAKEARSGAEQPVAGFHIRFGGGHSRTFSKTADHKNVSHSEVIIEGSGP